MMMSVIAKHSGGTKKKVKGELDNAGLNGYCGAFGDDTSSNSFSKDDLIK